MISDVLTVVAIALVSGIIVDVFADLDTGALKCIPVLASFK